jgi:hypothetical protein
LKILKTINRIIATILTAPIVFSFLLGILGIVVLLLLMMIILLSIVAVYEVYGGVFGLKEKRQNKKA